MSEFEFVLNGEKLVVKSDQNGDHLTIDSVKGESVFRVFSLDNGAYLLEKGNSTHRIKTLKVKDKIFVLTDNESYTFEIPTSKDSNHFGEDQGGHAKSEIRAPMPGKVVKIMVKEGDRVVPKQKLVIVEAMKMENPLMASIAGEVAGVFCKEGELVDSETVLIKLRPST